MKLNIKQLSNIDFNEIFPNNINSTISTNFPANPQTGTLCYRTDKNKLFQYNGTKWESSFGGGLSVWQSGGEYEVDNCVIYGAYIFRCTTKHTAGDEFDYDKCTHIGGQSGSLWKYNVATETVELKNKDEITSLDVDSNNETVQALVEEYCGMYSGTLWKYDDDGELVPKPLDDLSTADANVTREQIRDVAKEVGVPIGTIMPFAGNGDFPEGWLLCNGASVARTMYPTLFTIIGTTYGAVDDEHFNLPNLVDKFVEGGNASGASKSAGLPNITGATANIALTAWLPSSNGALSTSKNTEYVNAAYTSSVYDGNVTTTFLDASKSNSIYGNSTTVQPPSIVMRYAIKAFNGAEGNKGLVDTTNVLNELNTKFDKSGGQLSGTIKSSVQEALYRNVDNSTVVVNGGKTWQSGGMLRLYGQDAEISAGCFELSANNHGTTKVLAGYHNGTLTWAGNPVATTNKLSMPSGTGISLSLASGDAYTAPTDGWLVAYGFTTDTNHAYIQFFDTVYPNNNCYTVSGIADHTVTCALPVRKGAVVRHYRSSNLKNITMAFNYAQSAL